MAGMFQTSLAVGDGFLSRFQSLFSSSHEEFEARQHPDRGAPPKLGAWDLLAALTYHVLSGAGCFSAHVYQLFNMEIRDSSLSQRRQRLLGIYFLRAVPEDVVVEIAEGEKGG
jgi:hypothetical protein